MSDIVDEKVCAHCGAPVKFDSLHLVSWTGWYHAATGRSACTAEWWKNSTLAAPTVRRRSPDYMVEKPDRRVRSVRLGVNLNDQTAAALQGIVDRNQCSVTEAVRRAISIMSFLEKEVADGKVIKIHGPKGSVREIVIA